MKKVISLVLVLVMVLCLCGCGETNGATTSNDYEEVKNQLVGSSWNGDIDADFHSSEYNEADFYTWVAIIFNSDGSVRVHTQLCHKRVGTVDTREYLGTYEIDDSKITLNYTSTYRVVDCIVRDETSYSGSDSLQYTFRNGKLSVYLNGVELEKDIE